MDLIQLRNGLFILMLWGLINNMVQRYESLLCRARTYRICFLALNQCFNRGQKPMRHQRLFTFWICFLPERSVDLPLYSQGSLPRPGKAFHSRPIRAVDTSRGRQAASGYYRKWFVAFVHCTEPYCKGVVWCTRVYVWHLILDLCWPSFLFISNLHLHVLASLYWWFKLYGISRL